MDKRQLIADIRTLNATAGERFLEQFDDSALQQYLEHLQAAQKKEIRICRYVKASKTRRVA
jgi:hypothetical protein